MPGGESAAIRSVSSHAAVIRPTATIPVAAPNVLLSVPKATTHTAMSHKATKSMISTAAVGPQGQRRAAAPE